MSRGRSDSRGSPALLCSATRSFRQGSPRSAGQVLPIQRGRQWHISGLGLPPSRPLPPEPGPGAKSSAHGGPLRWPVVRTPGTAGDESLPLGACQEDRVETRCPRHWSSVSQQTAGGHSRSPSLHPRCPRSGPADQSPWRLSRLHRPAPQGWAEVTCPYLQIPANIWP